MINPSYIVPTTINMARKLRKILWCAFRFSVGIEKSRTDNPALTKRYKISSILGNMRNRRLSVPASKCLFPTSNPIRVGRISIRTTNTGKSVTFFAQQTSRYLTYSPPIRSTNAANTAETWKEKPTKFSTPFKDGESK